MLVLKVVIILRRNLSNLMKFESLSLKVIDLTEESTARKFNVNRSVFASIQDTLEDMAREDLNLGSKNIKT